MAKEANKLEFKQLECFITVAREKSFSKAAEIMYLSQPSVTSKLQKLERELGIKLLNRKNKNISLTEGGEIFYRYATELINLCAKAENSICEYKKNIEGVLTICASSIPEQYLLPYIVKSFKEKYPQVIFSIRHKDSKEVADEILAGTINFGFVGAKYLSEALEYIDFFDDKLVLVTSNDMKLEGKQVTVDRLFGKDIVIREEGSGTRLLIENALKEKDLDLSIFNSQTINESMEAVKKMVALGVGISFISEIAVKDEVATGQLVSYDIEGLKLYRHFSLAYSKNRCLSPIEEKFKEFVRNWQWEGIL